MTTGAGHQHPPAASPGAARATAAPVVPVIDLAAPTEVVGLADPVGDRLRAAP